MNDPMNPPAIVKTAEAFSLRQLAKRIRPKLRKEANNCMEVGEDMERVFGMVTGRARQDFLKKEFGISERQAWKYLKAWRGRDRIRENPSEQEDMENGLPASLAAAMRLLDEDDAPKEVAPSGSTPFQANGHATKPAEKAPEPAQEREPGEDEDYAKALREKIWKALCETCRRRGGGEPLRSCQKCCDKKERIMAGEEVKPGKITRPLQPKGPTETNGEVICDFGLVGKKVESLVGYLSGALIRMGADVSPESHPVWRMLRESLKHFTGIYEAKTKQKAPKNVWPLFPDETA